MNELVNISKLQEILNSDLLKDDDELNLTNYMKNIKKNILPVKYNTSSDIKDVGRVYPESGISLSNIRRQLRHTLAKGQYLDIDMVNATPTILSQICNANNIKCDSLIKYVSERDKLLKEYMKYYSCDKGPIKKLFISPLNGGSFEGWLHEFNIKIKTQSPFIRKYFIEVKEIVEIISSKNPELVEICTDLNKDNPINSTMAYFNQHNERLILEHMYTYLLEKDHIEKKNSNIILCHDGIMIPENTKYIPSKEKFLRQIETYIKTQTLFDIKLIIKDFDEAIEHIPKKIIKEINYNNNITEFKENIFNELPTLKKKKEYFEIYHCKILSPSMYIRKAYNPETEDVKLDYYSPQNFKNAYEHLDSGKVDNKGDPITFVKKWTLANPNIRSYNNIFIKYENTSTPLNETSSYNTFIGYSKHIRTPITDPNIIDDWKNVVKELCEGNEEYYNYYINWLAHIIQYPNNRVGTSIMFISNEGVGKGSHLKGIKNIIQNYYYTSSVKDDFIGKFAVAFDETLLVNWDETASCHDVIDQIKSAITEDTITIERKGIDKIKKKNNASIIFTSNNINAIPISDSNRRFVIYQSTDKYKINETSERKEFWEKFNKTVDEPEFIAALYKYLNEINLTDWVYSNFPKTNAYKRSQLQNNPPELLFMIDLMNGEIKDFEVSKTKITKIKGTELYHSYLAFCDSTGLNNKFKVSIKTFYSNMDVLKLKNGIQGLIMKTISGGVIEFNFNYLKINESLINKNYIPNPNLFID